MNFKTFKEYLLELKHVQTDRQTECINNFERFWKTLQTLTVNRNEFIPL